MLPLQIDIWSIIMDVSIGTWLGFLATIGTGFGALYIRRKRRITKLRRSLIAELEQHDLSRVIDAVSASESAVPPDESIKSLELEPSELPPAGTLPTQIYTSNTANLGILPEQEVEEIVSYYSTLLTQKAIISDIRSNDGVVTADQKELRDTVPDLNDDRCSLLQILKDTEEAADS